MTSRKPLDSIPSADPIMINYCWLCHFDARWCEHEGNGHKVGIIGGGSPNYQYARFSMGKGRGWTVAGKVMVTTS